MNAQIHLNTRPYFYITQPYFYIIGPYFHIIRAYSYITCTYLNVLNSNIINVIIIAAACVVLNLCHNGMNAATVAAEVSALVWSCLTLVPSNGASAPDG